MKNRQFLKKAVLPVFLVLVMLFVPTVSVSAVTEIDFASVYDIDRPINGQLFDFTAFMGNDYYKLLDKTTSTVQNGITWYDCTDGTYVKTDQKAISGHVYMVEVHVVPVAGYTFSPDTTGTVNGYEIGIVAGGGDEIALTYEFPACPYPAPVAFTSGSTFETGGTAAVDVAKTASNVMSRNDISSEMYNAALEQNVQVQWICSSNSSLNKSGESVTWNPEDVGKEFICRVGFYRDSACTDFVDYFDSKAVYISEGSSVFKILTTVLPVATVGQNYRVWIETNETEPAKFKEDRYSQLSEFGLTLSKNGVISGKPTKVGNCHVNLIAEGQGGEDYASLDITVEPIMPEITTKTLPEAVVGETYSITLKCNDPEASFGEYYNPGKANQLKESGLSITSKGVLKGTPAKAGTYTFTLCVVGDGGEGYATYTLTVKEAEAEETPEPESSVQDETAAEGSAPDAAQPEEAAPEEEPAEETDRDEQLDPTDTDTSAADKPAASQKDKQSAKGFPWWGYMLIAYAVIAVGAAIVVIIIVANKKKPKYPPNMRY